MASPAATAENETLRRGDNGAWTSVDGLFLLRTAYQPIVAFRGGRLEMVACEALTRISRDGLAVMPEAYFGALRGERRDRVEALTRTMHVRNAATISQGPRRLFLNFDPSALSSPAHFDSHLLTLGRELTQVDLTPRDIVCEFTENHVANGDHLTYFVYALRSRGYTVAIDDFGARASTPKRVVQVAPDIVKIDGAWAKALLDSADGYDRLKKTLREFEENGIVTVVEGLQETWQVDAVQRAGASMAQGFAICAPRLVPASFAEWTSPAPLQTGRKTFAR